MHDSSWSLRAACRGQSVELFYSLDEADIERALALCAGCPVREPCLEVATAEREQFGVWGGTTEAQRRRAMRRERRQRAA